jgi:hypothetical protein
MPGQMPSFEDQEAILAALRDRLEGDDSAKFNDREADLVVSCLERLSQGYGLSPAQSVNIQKVYYKIIGPLPGFRKIVPTPKKRKRRA